MSLKGQVLGFSEETGEGAIISQNGSRHTFSKQEWKGQGVPRREMHVDFEIVQSDDGQFAVGIYPDLGTREATPYETSKGRVLGYSLQTGEGVISGNDGIRYTFFADDWKEQDTPRRGVSVDFEVLEMEGVGKVAVNVYSDIGADVLVSYTRSPIPAASSVPHVKSRVTAGILAILLGVVGTHKFYLGHIGIGIVFS